MAQTVKPTANDQPRYSSKDLSKGNQSDRLQYKVEGIKSYNRGPSTRAYSRTIRG